MAFKVIVSPLAQNDIENSLEYYLEVSTDAPVKFIEELENAYVTLESSPYFKIIYKNYRAFPLKRFPFILVYQINNDEILIKACFHTSKSTKKYPK